jgi:hypothetical protein
VLLRIRTETQPDSGKHRASFKNQMMEKVPKKEDDIS